MYADGKEIQVAARKNFERKKIEQRSKLYILTGQR